MKQGLIVFLAMCVVASALVLRDRRAVETEEKPADKPDEGQKKKEVCAERTPCAWSIYKINIKFIEMNITNDYCECGVGLVCQYNEDNETTSSFVYRCRPPVAEVEVEVADDTES